MTDAPADPGPDRERPHDAVFDLTYDDERRARAVARSVAVEGDEIADDRSRAAVERQGRRVTVRVTAADPVALRAGCNTWLRLVGVAERLAD